MNELKNDKMCVMSQRKSVNVLRYSRPKLYGISCFYQRYILVHTRVFFCHTKCSYETSYNIRGPMQPQFNFEIFIVYFY